MARNRVFYDSKHVQQGLVEIDFSFAPNGTSAVDQSTIKGQGIASVARDDVGDFTITLEDTYKELIGAHFQVAHNADTDVVPQMGAVDVTSAKTVKIRILAGAVPTDIAAHANNRVYGYLKLRRTSIT